MTGRYATYRFNVTDLCTASIANPTEVQMFADALVQLADSMTSLLSEYYVEAKFLPDGYFLDFIYVEPRGEE